MLHNLPPLPPIKNEENAEPWDTNVTTNTRGKCIITLCNSVHFSTFATTICIQFLIRTSICQLKIFLKAKVTSKHRFTQLLDPLPHLAQRSKVECSSD